MSESPVTGEASLALEDPHYRAAVVDLLGAILASSASRSKAEISP